MCWCAVKKLLTHSLTHLDHSDVSWSLSRTLKAKFHYASWFEAGSKLVADRFELNSVTLAGSKLVRSWLKPASNQLRTSFEPASVMEFGFNSLPLTHIVVVIGSHINDERNLEQVRYLRVTWTARKLAIFLEACRVRSQNHKTKCRYTFHRIFAKCWSDIVDICTVLVRCHMR